MKTTQTNTNLGTLKKKISRKKKKLSGSKNKPQRDNEDLPLSPVEEKQCSDCAQPVEKSTCEGEILDGGDNLMDLPPPQGDPIPSCPSVQVPLGGNPLGSREGVKEITLLGRTFELQSLLALIFIPICVFAIYSNTYHVEFLYDDEKEIESQTELHITQLTVDNIKRAFKVSHRPVAKLSFALNYYFDRLEPPRYHLVNTLIHISNAILLYFFIKLTLGLPVIRRRRGPPGWVPLVTSLLWVVSPVHIQSVTYIVQRMNSMSAMFYLMTLLLYVQARLRQSKKVQWVMYVGCIVTTILALGSKEIAGTIPLVIFLYEWFFFQDLEVRWLTKRLPLVLAAVVLFLAVGLYYLGFDPVAKLQGKYAHVGFTMGQRVMTEWRVVMFYIRQLIFPHPSQLNLHHAFSISTSLFTPITTLISFLTIVASLIFAVVTAKNNRLVAFCILWFFVNLAIESSVIGLEIIYEHRSYLPSMLFFLLLVLVGHSIIRNSVAKKVVLVGLIGTCCFWTYSRNSTWANETNLWLDTIQKNPQASRAYNDLANCYAMSGQKKKAIAIYYQGLKLNFNDWKMHYNLGVILDSLWRSDEAIDQFNWVIKLKPNYSGAYHYLGMIYARKENYNKAIYYTSEAIRLDPVAMAMAKRNLALYKTWARTGGPKH